MSPSLMSEVEYVQGLLSLVTYRPGWTIEAFRTPYWNRVWILIDAGVLDALDGWGTTRVGVRAVVPEFTTANDFYDWLGKKLIRCERHESREFFQVDGQPWDSPHKVPQPPWDYFVGRRSGIWCVMRQTGPVVSTWDSWRRAYQAAWWEVIKDDALRGEDMING